MNLPNKLTICRMCAIPIVIVISLIDALEHVIIFESVNLQDLLLLIIFALASFTDYLDGHIARKYNLVTNFGKFLDPIADKLLNTSLMVFLLVPQSYAVAQRHDQTALTILMICVIIMIARDLVVDALRMIAVQKGEVIAANMFGKVKTVLQMIAIPMLLLNDFPFHYFDSSWPEALQVSNIFFYLATLMSLISGIIYLVQNHKVLKDTK